MDCRQTCTSKGITLTLDQAPDQIQGSVKFSTVLKPEEALWATTLAFVPANVEAFAPILNTEPTSTELTKLGHNALFSAQFGRGAANQSALMLAFDNAQQAQTAQQILLHEKEALPSYTYQTYVLQTVLDLNLSGWGIQQATIGVVDRYLVLGSSANVLENWVDALVVGNTLDKQLRHPPRGLWMRFGAEQGLGKLCSKLEQDLAIDLITGEMLQWEGPLQGNQWQVTTAPALKSSSSDQRVAWQLDLFGAHVRRLWAGVQGDQCWMESSNAQLSLLDPTGQVRWVKKLEAPIVGELTEVYHAETRQYLAFFATVKALHALQASGEEMPGYPLPLQLPTTSGLTVGGRDQYLFYACADGRIYGLTRNGQPLAGWNPGPKLGTIRQPLAFFQSADADFLLALTEKALHVLNRAAQAHFPSLPLNGPLNSPPQWQWDTVGKRIVVADAAGKAQIIGAKGEHFPLALTPGQLGSPRFIFDQVCGDARKDYLAASGKHLYLWTYGPKGYKKVFERGFAAPIDALQSVGKRIVVTLPERHEVWVLDEQGRGLVGMPVAGDVAQCLAGAKVLVTGVGDRVYGYVLK